MASENGGGVFNQNYHPDFSSGLITLTNCTVTGNSAQGGGGVFNFIYNGVNGSITLTNCISYHNTSGSSGTEEVANDAASTSEALVKHSDVRRGSSEAGSFDADPQFVDAADGDFHLQPTSPCLGAGTADGAPHADKDGTVRPLRPSIGAYELSMEATAPTSPATTHILWNKTDGAASLWNYQTKDGTFTQNTYGPYPGWTAEGIADAHDLHTRLLWTHSDGSMSLWDLDNATAGFTQHTFGPYPEWTATAVSAQ